MQCVWRHGFPLMRLLDVSFRFGQNHSSSKLQYMLLSSFLSWASTKAPLTCSLASLLSVCTITRYTGSRLRGVLDVVKEEDCGAEDCGKLDLWYSLFRLGVTTAACAVVLEFYNTTNLLPTITWVSVVPKGSASCVMTPLLAILTSFCLLLWTKIHQKTTMVKILRFISLLKDSGSSAIAVDVLRPVPTPKRS